MAYQSLYRRYRSRNFAEIKGQSHVTTALQNAVAEGRHSHAYLFSGPRGTGKTSSARVLAKALNCENVVKGEPCTTCDSCIAIDEGKSFDIHELDAASNNKVDDIRDLISKVQLGSPGRTKVYILDEVHMLSTGAENALLKTLEEPPEHVVFVLATTEPHKVVPTIRSRTQHFEFRLLPAEELAEHIAFVAEDAGLDVDSEAIDYALAQGGGSARDTLSALDLVAAAGGVPTGSNIGVELVRAIGSGDSAGAITQIQEALVNGLQPRTIGEKTLEVIRNTFLHAMGASVDHLSDTARLEVEALAKDVKPGALTRSLEHVGQALVEIRQAPDPRVPLEVAMLRLTRRDGTDTDGLLQRIEALETQVAAGLAASPQTPAAAAPSPAATAPAATASAAPTPAARERVSSKERPDASPPPSDRGETSPGPDDNKAAATARPRPRRRPTPARSTPSEAASKPSVAEEPSAARDVASPSPAVKASKVEAADPDPQPEVEVTPTSPSPVAASESAEPEQTAVSTSSTPVSLEAAGKAMSTQLDGVSQRARVRFKGGQVHRVDGSTIFFAVPNQIHCDRCSEVKKDVETALSAHFGQAISVEVIVDNQASGTMIVDPAKIERGVVKPELESEEEVGPVSELADAEKGSTSGVERLTKAFPGSKVIEQPPS